MPFDSNNSPSFAIGRFPNPQALRQSAAAFSTFDGITLGNSILGNETHCSSIINNSEAKDGITPMTLEEWVDAQVADAPHLFESNAGGGAASNGAGGAAGSQRSVKNPFRKESWNLTEQMKLQKSDPSLAARLKAAA
jgi:hypothetical protein